MSSTHTINNNKHLLELFLESIKSEKTKEHAPFYLRQYAQHWLMVDDEGVQYTEFFKGDVQNRLAHFVIYKKKRGLGADGIDNYINFLFNFFKANGHKNAADWETIRSFKPAKVKKTKDREYFDEEVFAIEDKLDARGRAITGLMRGSGVRRGSEPTLSVGDIIPRDIKYGKIYKIWVYRNTPDEYPTACTPETARKIDEYLEYRLRMGEVCPKFEKDHYHEYHDGEEVTNKPYKAGDIHLDPDAPLIRDDFNERDSFKVKHPKRLEDETISWLVRQAAITSGIRTVNKGQQYKRHRVMVAHGFRKLFKKRCRQAKMDAIILERFMGHRSGNTKEGITKLMMIYDAEDWLEMEEQFIQAIPHLTLSKDAKLKNELELKEKEIEKEKELNQTLNDRTKEIVKFLMQNNKDFNPSWAKELGL